MCGGYSSLIDSEPEFKPAEGIISGLVGSRVANEGPMVVRHVPVPGGSRKFISALTLCSSGYRGDLACALGSSCNSPLLGGNGSLGAAHSHT